MAGFDRQERSTSGSLIGSLINPISELKWQYLSGASFINYFDIAKKGSLGYRPIYLTTLFGPHGISPFSAFDPKNPQIGKRVLGFFTRPAQIDPINSLGKLMGYSGEELLSFRSQVGKGYQDFLKNGRWRRMAKGDIISMLSKYMPDGAIKARFAQQPELFGKAALILRRGQTISRIGSVLGPVMAGITAGETAANLAGLWFKGSLAALNYADAAVHHMKNLEMGGELGPGFRSGAAATERQRAIKELQRTPLAGRRFMGQEANIYSGLI